jgi:hypothetical protein
VPSDNVPEALFKDRGQPRTTALKHVSTRLNVKEIRITEEPYFPKPATHNVLEMYLSAEQVLLLELTKAPLRIHAAAQEVVRRFYKSENPGTALDKALGLITHSLVAGLLTPVPASEG